MLFSLGAAAAVFLALFFGLQWHIALCTVLAVGVYFGLFLLLKPTRRLNGPGHLSPRRKRRWSNCLRKRRTICRVLKEAASLRKVRHAEAGRHPVSDR